MASTKKRSFYPHLQHKIFYAWALSRREGRTLATLENDLAQFGQSELLTYIVHPARALLQQFLQGHGGQSEVRDGPTYAWWDRLSQSLADLSKRLFLFLPLFLLCFVVFFFTHSQLALFLGCTLFWKLVYDAFQACRGMWQVYKGPDPHPNIEATEEETQAYYQKFWFGILLELVNRTAIPLRLAKLKAIAKGSREAVQALAALIVKLCLTYASVPKEDGLVARSFGGIASEVAILANLITSLTLSADRIPSWSTVYSR